MILHEEAFKAFKASDFDVLPRQRCEDTRNANLGNWQASSSFAKQAAFYAWIVNRHPKLAGQEAFVLSFDLDPEAFTASASYMRLGQTVSLDYRASDTQLVWWGKLCQSASQPSMKALGVEVGAFAWQLPNFKTCRRSFTQRQALIGAQLPVLGSFPAIGSKTASSIQTSTGSLQRAWEKLRRLHSLSRSSLRKELRRSSSQLQQLQLHQLCRASGRSKPSL